MTRMHEDELELDEALVRRLLAEQFPDWGELPLHRVQPDGTVNAIFQLGNELSVRLPRRNGPTGPGGREVEWLPKLAPQLPVEIPLPVAQGRPGDGYHGDLDVRNWLVRNGRISGVIDWGAMGVGDPACDVMVAWKLHSTAARDAFREALTVDDATWERARGWVVSQSVAALAYYTPENNPSLYHEAESWLGLVMSERS